MLADMDEPSVYIEFSPDELWLLRSVVRHEWPQQDSWKFPPADASMNHEIALLIAAGGPGLLELTEGACKTLDYTVPQDAKDKDGRPIGKDVLRKVCEARRDLAFGYALAQEPAIPSKGEIAERLLARKRPRNGPRKVE